MKLQLNFANIAASTKESVTDWKWWSSIGQIVLGCFLVAVAFVVFINPYNMVPGGIYGLALVLHNLFPSIQVGTFGYMFDVPLILTALILFGGTFGGRTIFASFITPGIMNILDYLYTHQRRLSRLSIQRCCSVVRLTYHSTLCWLLSSVVASVARVWVS